MSEIVVKNIAGSHETDINGDPFFAVFMEVEGDGAPDLGRVRVLAKSEDKWKPGAKALCEIVKGGFEGPDGEKNWTYCKLKNPDQNKFGARRGTSSSSSSSKGASTAGAPAADRPMPTVTYTEASAAFDDFLQEASISSGSLVEGLLANFGEAKPSPDAILAAAAALTLGKANSLFAAYVKSFRIAYQSKQA